MPDAGTPIDRLVQKFRAHIREYKSPGIKDAEIRLKFIDPTRAEVLALARPIGHPSRRKRPGRKPLRTSTRWAIFKRDRNRCIACGRAPGDDPSVKLEVDHIVPVARGGSDDAANLQTLCRECNRGKRDRM